MMYMLDSNQEPSYNLSKNLLLLSRILKLIEDMVEMIQPPCTVSSTVFFCRNINLNLLVFYWLLREAGKAKKLAYFLHLHKVYFTKQNWFNENKFGFDAMQWQIKTKLNLSFNFSFHDTVYDLGGSNNQGSSKRCRIIIIIKIK